MSTRTVYPEFTEPAVRRAEAWRDAAVADGWSIEPTYPEHEDVSRAARLTRDGFIVMLLTRTPREQYGRMTGFEGTVNAWGPDGMSIMPGDVYPGFEVIKSMVRHCNNCNADDVDTVRYSFAGRCCNKCINAMRAEHEYQGWEK